MSAVQTTTQDRTKGPVGLSGTVLDTKVLHPRIAGEQATLAVTIMCAAIRCHIHKAFDDAKSAIAALRQIPPGSHLSAFGEAHHFHMRNGELYLSTQRVITYSLVSDFTQRNLFNAVE